MVVIVVVVELEVVVVVLITNSTSFLTRGTGDLSIAKIRGNIVLE